MNAAMRDLLRSREALGHKTQLRQDCEQLVSEEVIEEFLKEQRCTTLQQCLHSIFDDDEAQLRGALVRFERTWLEENGQFGVGA